MMRPPAPPRPEREWFSSASEYLEALDAWLEMDAARRRSDAWDGAIIIVSGTVLLSAIVGAMLFMVHFQFGWRGLGIVTFAAALFALAVTYVQRRLAKR